MQVEYKKGFRLELEDHTVISIERPSKGLYRVIGYYGSNYPSKYLEMFYSPVYTSLKGCANYMKKYFDIDLIY